MRSSQFGNGFPGFDGMGRMPRRSVGGGLKLFGMGCGTIILVILLINVTIGALCFDYSLDYYFGTDVEWWKDAIGGLVLGEITIPNQTNNSGSSGSFTLVHTQ